MNVGSDDPDGGRPAASVPSPPQACKRLAALCFMETLQGVRKRQLSTGSVRRLRPSIHPRSQCLAPCACCCTGGHNKLGVAWCCQAVLPAMRDALWRLMSMQTARLHVVLCSEIICSPRTLTMDGEQKLVDWWCTHATFSAALRLHGSTYYPYASAVCVRPAVAAVCGCSQARSDIPTNITYRSLSLIHI